MAKVKFTDETSGIKNNEKVVQAIEPKMFPARFRERATFKQRSYLFIMVILYSIAVGVATFTLMSGLASKMYNTFYGYSNFIIITTVLAVIVMFLACFNIFWSKIRKFLVSDIEFWLSLIAPLAIIASFLYLSTWYNFDKTDPVDLLFVIGLGTVISGATGPILNVLRLAIFSRKFRVAFKKSLFLFPGAIIASAPNLILWFFEKDKKIFALGTKELLPTVASIGIGIILIVIGVLLSLKYEVKGAKNVWGNVRFTAALATLTIYTSLATIGLKFAAMEFPFVVIISIITNVSFIFLLIIYVIFRGGIKNILKLNPVFSNIILKIFIIGPLATSLVLVVGMPEISFLKDYGPPSFTILFVTAVTIIIGLFIIHVAKIITYSKFFKGTIIGGFLALLIIIAVVLSITVLKNSNIIFQIVARQIVILFLIFSLVVEVIGLFANIFYIVTSTILKFKKKPEKNSEVATAKVKAK